MKMFKRFLNIGFCAAVLMASGSPVFAQSPETTAPPVNVVTTLEGVPSQAPTATPQPPVNTASPQNKEDAAAIPGYDPVQASLRLGEALERHIKISKPSINPGEMPTLFFTLWQHALLQEAKIGLMTRAPTQSELNSDDPNNVKGIREISLGGIVFDSTKKWTIWLNNQRVTPDALPREIIDLKVKPEFVELKWFDSYTNQIYPIRLGAHQRFNLDTRIFLPGIGDTP
jgi:hypothetical protein